MKKLGTVILLLLAGSATAADRLQAVQVAGLTVPGTPAMGKALGFTACEDKYSYYECKRNKPLLVYGAAADSASVFIDGKDNFSITDDTTTAPKVSEVPQEKLSYRSIRLNFDVTERETLENALKADGWLKAGSGNSRSYFKEGVPAAFKIHRSLTSLTPVDLSEVQSQVAKLKGKAAEAAKASTSSSSFIDAMQK
ncbi:hypothetical protein [Pseudomonas asiatica]|uniref:Uncharacterized protein n=1 Tax=Pseudomonas asiatica TaxID=2219225 RepID=A0A9X4HXA0_9PSED|nr:hypothetical protein [Pseudomonas asiatica]MDD2109299.1 hypothetical protein [Pseudomonas asiatica]